MNLAQRFKISRVLQKKSQWDLALATGGLVRQFEISLFENQKIQLPDKKLNALLETLEMSEDQELKEIFLEYRMKNDSEIPGVANV